MLSGLGSARERAEEAEAMQSILKLNLEDSNQNKLDISNFEKGLYLFKFSNKNDLRTFKIIKE